MADEQENLETQAGQEAEEQESQEQAESQGEEQQDDVDRRVKGLEAAASNERKKRQLAEQEAERIRRELESLKRPRERETSNESTANKPPDLDAEFDRRWQAKEREKRIESWTGTMAEAQERFEDVDLGEALNEVGTALGRFGPAGSEIADQIIASDKSWDVLAYLQQNPDALNRLSQMGPVAAAVEIGRLESKVGGGGSSPSRVTSAPDPIRPNSSAARPTKDPDKMTLAEYEQHVREKRGGSVWPR